MIKNYQIIGGIFLTLKLCGVIDWRWVYVLAPYWIYLILETIGELVETYDDKPAKENA